MSWGLWVHAGDVAKEGVPALLDEVANGHNICLMGHKLHVDTVCHVTWLITH